MTNVGYLHYGLVLCAVLCFTILFHKLCKHTHIVSSCHGQLFLLLVPSNDPKIFSSSSELSWAIIGVIIGEPLILQTLGKSENSERKNMFSIATRSHLISYRPDFKIKLDLQITILPANASLWGGVWQREGWRWLGGRSGGGGGGEVEGHKWQFALRDFPA